MLRFGPDGAPVVVVALPLFEEANRVRAFAVKICRLLAKRGIASILPDLPGQGESVVATEDVRLATLREGFGAAVEQFYREGLRVYSASITNGALVDTDAHSLGRWHLSPVSGRDVLQGLARILGAAGREHDVRQLRHIDQADERAFPIEIAGNLIGGTMLEDLNRDRSTYALDGVGIPRRVVRLETDLGGAHRHVPGAPVWRRAEPGNDPALAVLLADDIAGWVAACEG